MRQIINPNIQQIPIYQQQQMQGNQSIAQKITDYLNDNNRLITQAYISQCHQNYEQALEQIIIQFDSKKKEKILYQVTKHLDKLVNRMVSMMENADKNPRMRQTIYENREILSESQIKENHELNQANLNKSIDQNYYLDYYLSSLPVKKQIEKKQEKKKVYWTEQEKDKFKEALQKFGRKELKKISEFIGTKKPIQVRSHMQKYFKRLEKENKQLLQVESANNSEKKVQGKDRKKINEEEQELSNDNSNNLQNNQDNKQKQQQKNKTSELNNSQYSQESDDGDEDDNQEFINQNDRQQYKQKQQPEQQNN